MPPFHESKVDCFIWRTFAEWTTPRKPFPAMENRQRLPCTAVGCPKRRTPTLCQQWPRGLEAKTPKVLYRTKLLDAA